MKEKYQLLAIGPGEDEVVYAAQCEMTARTECEHNENKYATQCEIITTKIREALGKIEKNKVSNEKDRET